MQRLLAVTALLSTLDLTGCSRAGSSLPSPDIPSSGPVSVPRDCPQPGTDLEISVIVRSWEDARGRAADAGEVCLAAPAGEPFSVTLRNDHQPVAFFHNFSVYADAARSHTLFNGGLVYPGESVEYDLPALEAGEYQFRCDIHPRKMLGFLVVE